MDRHDSAERVELAGMYPGKGWAKKVLNMSDQQVHEALISIKKRRENEKYGRKEGT